MIDPVQSWSIRTELYSGKVGRRITNMYRIMFSASGTGGWCGDIIEIWKIREIVAHLIEM
ncbi:hypothetical protein AMATHDRAFT_65697, partial [Amanita thiersii Skay4041]